MDAVQTWSRTEDEEMAAASCDPGESVKCRIPEYMDPTDQFDEAYVPSAVRNEWDSIFNQPVHYREIG